MSEAPVAAPVALPVPWQTVAVRLAVVVSCYGVSILGLMMTLLGVASLIREGTLGMGLLALVWLFAWVCHLRMSWAWIRNRRVSRFWPRWGTVTGLASLLSPFAWSQPGVPLGDGLIFITFVAFFLLPAIGLAVHLVRFHAQATENN